MTDQKTDNDYIDMTANIEMTPEMEKIFVDVLTVIDESMASLQQSERIALGMRIATTISATTLANALKDNRHLLNSAIEAIAEDTASMTEQTFNAFDDGKLTSH